MNEVHIRRGQSTRCGVDSGESISLKFLLNHLFIHKDDCCKNLWNRLCPICMTKANE